MKNKIHFSLWVFDCDFEDALSILIFLNRHETGSSSILNSCKQIWRVERAALLCSAPGGTYPRYVTDSGTCAVKFRSPDLHTNEEHWYALVMFHKRH